MPCGRGGMVAVERRTSGGAGVSGRVQHGGGGLWVGSRGKTCVRIQKGGEKRHSGGRWAAPRVIAARVSRGSWGG